MIAPKFSVIIPTYNRGEFVVKAVESVINQTFKDVEILVIDDGSTDNTRTILKPYAHIVRYFYQENMGVSAARNTGINRAGGEWLAFLDSDDEWRPEYLSRQIERTAGVTGICMQAANCRFTGLNGQTTSYFEINGSLAEFRRRDYLFLRDPFCFIVKHGPWQLGSTIILSEAVKRAGMFDTRLRISEDYDLMARVGLQGPFGMLREELVNIYRRHETNTCLTREATDSPIEARESDGAIFEKLSRIGTLSSEQRKALNEVFSANRRGVGNLLLERGRVKEARDAYRRAISLDPSVRSWGRYILSWSCGIRSRCRRGRSNAAARPLELHSDGMNPPSAC
jgi:glycosyltransferase involved in cell wall biosynthesis